MVDVQTRELSTRHPYHEARRDTILSNHQLVEIIDNNHKEMYSKIFYAFSLVFSILLTVFASQLNWTVVWLLIDALTLWTVMYAIAYNKRRQIYAKKLGEIRQGMRTLGIPFEATF